VFCLAALTASLLKRNSIQILQKFGPKARGQLYLRALRIQIRAFFGGEPDPGVFELKLEPWLVKSIKNTVQYNYVLVLYLYNL
jgi:hypothetical protein